MSIKCNYEAASGLHQVALHVNGFDDLVASINYFQPFEHSQISVGQYKLVPPFIGRLQNFLIFLYPVEDMQLRSIAKNYDIPTILKNTLYNESMSTFLQQSQVPATQFAEVGVAESFFKKVEEEKAETAPEEEEQPAPRPFELFAEFFQRPESDELVERVAATLAPGKYEYLMKACGLMCGGIEANFQERIELERFMLALSYIESPLSLEDVWLLCEVSELGSSEDGGEGKGKQKFLQF